MNSERQGNAKPRFDNIVAIEGWRINAEGSVGVNVHSKVTNYRHPSVRSGPAPDLFSGS